MSRHFKPIITGCDLHLPSGKKYHGDLWSLPGHYLFNAVIDARAQAREIEEVNSLDPKYLTVLRDDDNWDYWERRGVFLIPVEFARLSPEAQVYVNKWKDV